jgi:hypothetical protein
MVTMSTYALNLERISRHIHLSNCSLDLGEIHDWINMPSELDSDTLSMMNIHS